ncbi:MAG: hypothetical protein IJA95_06530 [Bacteroidaceae bacterium]|nr:hypothetical protein [Bacteroidaceae bacterium]
MTGLALQIDGKWAVLSEGDSVNIENNSPVWGEGNSFSLPFELDIEANRHILGNADQITGQSVYEVLDGKRAVLYTLGIPVYYGKIKMEDEVELSDGKVYVTLVSGNLTFDEMIDGMNCQDVELLDEIIVGEGVTDFQMYGELGWLDSYSASFPEEFMHMKVNGVSTVNVTKPYPQVPYCNARICYQLPEKSETTAINNDYPDVTEAENLKIGLEEGGDTGRKYVVLGADRPLSGLCFFVLYFLDCLFSKLNLDFSNDGIKSMEDMCRLAFFSTRCDVTYETTDEMLEFEDVQKIVPSFRWKGGYVNYCIYKKLLKATSKNFPDVDVSEVIDALKSGFGIRFLLDERSNSMSCFYLKDILRNPNVTTLYPEDIYEASKVENNVKGFRMSYSGDDDNTSYSYNEWSNVSLIEDYNTAKSSVTSYNQTCYVDKRIGNAYRVKVDKDAKTTLELRPSLVEVAEFIPVEYGDCSNEDFIESVEVNFSPVAQNDVNKRAAERLSNDTTNNSQTFATFLDVEMLYPAMVPYISFSFYTLAGLYGGGTYEFQYTYYSSQRQGDSEETKVSKYALPMEHDNAIRDYDTGLTFGVMRGPSRESGTEDYEQNYDGEGNFKYVMVAQDYTFHSDTVDNYARLFDYNGSLEGGVDTSGRFSLKLRAEKPTPKEGEPLVGIWADFGSFWWAGVAQGKTNEQIEAEWLAYQEELKSYQKKGYFPITETYAQRRGLFDKFYSEYAYFVVNRKIVRMKCRMEMADLLNIDWTKRYKIGEYVGFINKYSYSVSSTGISDVELEMYYI